MDIRLLKLNFKTYLLALSDLMMPRVCVVCRRPLYLREKCVCLKCMAGLPYTYNEKMPHNAMADRYNEQINAKDPESKEPYQWAVALLRYENASPYNRIPQSLKYERNIYAGRYFSGQLADRIKAGTRFSDIDLIIPVPLHPCRQWKRGYNQAEVIAGVLSKELGVPMETRLLKRARNTASQTQKTHEERQGNVADAFTLNPRRLHVLEGKKHILLVDDVFTTGATLTECHKKIRTATAARISVATLSCV